VGWSIDQILLDFAGGILSLLQLLVDASLQADWSGLTGQCYCITWQHTMLSRLPLGQICLIYYCIRSKNILGNPVKLGLSNISMCFDIIFFTQHYM
jgi:cystinosin